jgi:hypothetical protein
LNGATTFVGVEEITDLLPDGVRRRVVLHDHVHEVIGERGINPHEDSDIRLHPGGIVGAWIVGVDVRKQIETLENDAERIMLAQDKSGLHVKSNGNKALDVYALGGM